MTQPTTSEFEFEGRSIPFQPGDTVASALYRAGVRAFSRSFKYHRRRGLLCLSGDCPNCMLNVNGEPCVRACATPAAQGQKVRRETGWPSTDFDVFAVLGRLGKLLPVGFYYKTFLRPQWLWPRLEPLLRWMAGRGEVDQGAKPEHRELRHLHPDVVVIGAGVSGLSAAIAAAEAGKSVVLCDSGSVGETCGSTSHRERVLELKHQAMALKTVTLLERTNAIGIYEGPLVVMDEPSFLQLAHPDSIVVATGAVEELPVFPGNDLPGVWLGRGAMTLANHGLAPGRRVVLVTGTPESHEIAQMLRDSGASVTTVSGSVVEARGRRRLRGVVIDGDGARQTYVCDSLVLSCSLTPRLGLARQAEGDPAVVVIGDALSPGLKMREAEEQGRRAGRDERVEQFGEPRLPPNPQRGLVCLCEDVGVGELRRAWAEGFRSTEILKRYTTATMGPCQGQLCQRHLQAFVTAREGATGPAAGPTTSRPPSRGITLEHAAAGLQHQAHQRTALHSRHTEFGAAIEMAGVWERPQHYRDVVGEYWAVRRSVSVMDVGTLGKFAVVGSDATKFLELLYPCRIATIRPGRVRYALLLDEHGFVADDGIVCAVGPDHWYVTFTSSGASTAEATLRDWAEAWSCDVQVVDLTAARGAINVAGPLARELLGRLTPAPIDNEAFPYLGHRQVTVAGVACDVFRLGFVGELSYELHHSSDRSNELWDALLLAGADLGVRPHGLDALRTLRLEKSHIIVGQDTDFDTTPRKLNMDWIISPDKSWYLGKTGLERANSFEPKRRLVSIAFRDAAPREGAALFAGEQTIGHLTSAAWSHALEIGVSLGWIEQVDGGSPSTITADGIEGVVVAKPFYDPDGVRLRA